MNFSDFRKRCFERQVDLANELGIKNTTVSMWETGRSKPSIDMLPKLAELLKVDVSDLVKCFSHTGSEEE